MQQGGTEVLVQELIRGLAQHYELVLVSGDRKLADLPRELADLISKHFSWDLLRPTLASARGLAASLRAEGVVLTHFHLGGTYEWASRRFWKCPIYYLAKMGVPCLSTNHLAVEWLNCGCDPSRPSWQKWILQSGAWLSRVLVYRQLRTEVTVSEHDYQRVKGAFPMFAPRITQRYHSLLRAELAPPILEHRDPSILCVGTIGGRKAQPILAEAFAQIAGRHRQWTLDFVGRIGEQLDAHRIEGIAAKAGIQDRVYLRGRLSDAETLRWMQRSSIIAMPSLQEGLGLSLQEALFHGCVGVGSRAGGIPELIEHEINGLLVLPGDKVALGAALDRLMSDPVLLAKFRAQSRTSILRKGMTAEAMVKSYTELYQGILDGIGGARPKLQRVA